MQLKVPVSQAVAYAYTQQANGFYTIRLLPAENKKTADHQICRNLERATRFELATSTLARWRSAK
jgi:hypothetical protein